MLVPLHNQRVPVTSHCCLVYPSKVPKKKKGNTDYWLFFIVPFQTAETNFMTERERGMGKEKHGLFTQWNNLQQLKEFDPYVSIWIDSQILLSEK